MGAGCWPGMIAAQPPILTWFYNKLSFSVDTVSAVDGQFSSRMAIH